jgi:hypothetical protein
MGRGQTAFAEMAELGARGAGRAGLLLFSLLYLSCVIVNSNSETHGTECCSVILSWLFFIDRGWRSPSDCCHESSSHCSCHLIHSIFSVEKFAIGISDRKSVSRSQRSKNQTKSFRISDTRAFLIDRIPTDTSINRLKKLSHNLGFWILCRSPPKTDRRLHKIGRAVFRYL